MPPTIYTENEWARVQPYITKLYSDEGKSLKELIERMKQDHDFHAT